MTLTASEDDGSKYLDLHCYEDGVWFIYMKYAASRMDLLRWTTLGGLLLPNYTPLYSGL